MGVIQALVDAALDKELGLVGAGPMEELFSDGADGARFMDDVERRARQQPRFRKAVAGMWLGKDVPRDIRDRLTPFGADRPRRGREPAAQTLTVSGVSVPAKRRATRHRADVSPGAHVRCRNRK